ncbi:LysR family transcriptional regulator [Roseburia hominis]
MKEEMLYVYTVYQEGSFSKAAKKLFLTQPALSISIQKIEQSIGMPLFDRSRRPLKLTDAGEIYIELIKKTLLLEREQQQKLNDIRNVVTGTIKLGGSHYLNAYIMPDILAGFVREYPGVKLEIMEASSYDLADMLADYKLDLTFNCNPALIKNYNHYKVFEDHILLAVPEEHSINARYADFALTASEIFEGRHLSADCPMIELAAFSELELILLRKGNNLYDRAWAMFHEAGFKPKIKLDLSQLVTAYRLARANMAATFVSDRLVRPEDTSLKFYRLDSSHTTRIFYALLPNKEYVPAAVNRFIQYMQNNL